MKAAIAAVLVTLLFGAAATVDAAWYPKKRLPKAIDFPRLRPKLKETHKAIDKQKHPPSAVGASLVLAPDTDRA
jgi:hypothetical protein